jgi:uncharacterized low-complexity protein
MVRRTALIAAAAVSAAAIAPASASAQQVAPDVTKLKVTPAAFKPLATGGPVVLSGGTVVSFEILNGANVAFSVKQEKTGKRAGGKCVAGKAKTKKGRCTRTTDVPGGFTLVGISGPNEFRFSGRIADKALAPGKYRLVAKAEGTAARSSFARFSVIK